MGARVAVVGAGGYAGGELLRLISAHPDLTLHAACANERAGSLLADVHPQVTSLAEVELAPAEPALLAGADLVLLAVPAGRSGPLAAALPADAAVVDLGPDHRLADPAAWARYHPGPHAGTWTYGLPELPGARAEIAGTRRVAAAGCYATAVNLALAPLLRAGLADPRDVVVVAASGTSGAGRAAQPHLIGAEVMGDLSAYRVGAHQHVPEIKAATGAASLSFTPLLAPMPRGILATVTARPAVRGLDADALRSALAAAYAGEPFVRVLPAGRQPRTAATLGANTCHLGTAVDLDSGRLIVTSALDNLGKGAAGQAIQCANLMLGLPETAGLGADGIAP